VSGEEVQPIGAHGASEEDIGTLRQERDFLRTQLQAERSKGLLRRLFGVSPTIEDTDRATETRREKMRGRLAIALVLTLIVVVGLTFWYLLLLSRKFGDLTTDDLMTLIPMVGTTLLTPIVGLIGAVMGFYYGGQTAVQGAHSAAQAAQQPAEAATQAALQAMREATQVATQTASDVATQAATEAATQVARGANEGVAGE
jgi:hypothetical protein